jgi:hypothetical protein
LAGVLASIPQIVQPQQQVNSVRLGQKVDRFSSIAPMARIFKRPLQAEWRVGSIGGATIWKRMFR